MLDLKALTVRALRDLARKHVGRGYTRLKTRSQLVAALLKTLPRQIDEALDSRPTSRSTASQTATSRTLKGGVSAAMGAIRHRFTSAAVASEPRTSKPSDALQPATAKTPDTKVIDVAVQAGAVPVSGAGKREPMPPRARGPAPGEGAHEPDDHLLARVGGSIPATSHGPSKNVRGPTEIPEPQPIELEWDAKLGDLPERYGEDTLVLLQRDPHTLYAYWEVGVDARRKAFGEGAAHEQLRVFDAGQLIREIDVDIGWRGYYLFNLLPGHTYTAELVAVGRKGEAARIGARSNPARLPPLGPSPDVDDRFGFIPFDAPLGRLFDLARPLLRASVPAKLPSELREHLYQLSGGEPLPEGALESAAEAPADAVFPAAPPATHSPGGVDLPRPLPPPPRAQPSAQREVAGRTAAGASRPELRIPPPASPSDRALLTGSGSGRRGLVGSEVRSAWSGILGGGRP
jgi:hypothetical protein